ncbi:hypothetical protein [Virgibacillus siamensis]|uniref:hypothetical protein n=1 Tax=Virgibacillus siamensis TaxID=480071 RepID=UPI000987434E|nr:hypothetical protein [Virgibacillus siamensis]
MAVENLEKEKFADTISELSEQIRLMEQKYTLRVDDTILQQFHVQQQQINRTKSSIKKLSKLKPEIKFSAPNFKVRKKLS